MRNQNAVYSFNKLRLKIRVNGIREKFVCIRSPNEGENLRIPKSWKRKETTSVSSDFFLASGGIKAEQTSAPLSCVYRGFLDYRCNRRPPHVFLGSCSFFRRENVKKSLARVSSRKWKIHRRWNIGFDVAESTMNSIRHQYRNNLSIEACFNCINLIRRFSRSFLELLLDLNRSRYVLFLVEKF